MRTTILLTTLTILGTSTTQAQELTNIIPQRQSTLAEGGVFGQTSFSNQSENMTLLGVQYKKWVTDLKGIRVIAGYSSYSNRTIPFEYATAGDTTIERSTETNINLGVVGVGAEMQRHFYKKVYLYAALELRGGYGSGKQDTMVRRNANTGPIGTTSTMSKAGTGNANMYYLGFMPSIGAKLQFKRICIGTEITGIETSYKQTKVDGGQGSGVFDMSLGNISQRLFVNYRF